ncbi:ATP-grasp domain-containing protein [Goodfellowiella coeruleoviolacea]|uniref:Biotin carboxylase n=1 Tax=Goodfellowiella coeruleoviolacea TaxID=334858 RepID=A0AAE3GHW5_9PSEU|nr:ATP-grasp domain-containing protein [Goodfellowiella coeruleoviolacea]MCP2167697.1 Biotin carboxylase [Goodfellowiella coeruleoviolacea]
MSGTDVRTAGAPWLVLVESNTTGTGLLFATTGRALGLRPVLLAADPARYPYADGIGLEVVRTDTGDAEALRESCARLAERAPVGAVTSSSEYFIAAAAALAAELGLPGPDAEAVRRCRDKAVQRRVLSVLPASPDHVECATPDQAAEAARRLGGTVVVKPCQGSGSEGVRACEGPEQARSWAERLLSTRHNERGMPVEPRVLVEQALTGPEYSVELLGGEVYAIVAKHLGAPPFFVEVGHDCPARLPEEQARGIADTAREAVRLLGLTWGPAHVEVRHTARGPAVVEVNPRLAGGMIPHLVRLATGRDLIAAVLGAALGRRPRLAEGAGHHAAIRFVTVPGDGTLSAVTGLDRARAVPGVVDVRCTATPGQRLTVHHSFRDRVGHVIAVGETERDAVTAAETAVAGIELTIAPPSAPLVPAADRTSSGGAA